MISPLEQIRATTYLNMRCQTQVNHVKSFNKWSIGAVSTDDLSIGAEASNFLQGADASYEHEMSNSNAARSEVPREGSVSTDDLSIGAEASDNSSEHEMLNSSARSRNHIIQVVVALQVVLSEIIPSLKDAIDTWHHEILQRLPSLPIASYCKHGKPKRRSSCSVCLSWAQAIDNACYQGAGRLNWEPCWRNADSHLFGADSLQVIKLFAFDYHDFQKVSSLFDFDIAAILMIIGRFAPFHNYSPAFYDVVLKVLNIRNSIVHFKLGKHGLDAHTFSQYWTCIQEFVDAVLSLQRESFTGDTVRYISEQLKQISETDFDDLRQTSRWRKLTLSRHRHINHGIHYLEDINISFQVGLENYIRCAKALQLVLLQTIPFLNTIVMHWYLKIRQQCGDCKCNVRQRRRPSARSGHCISCIAWADAIVEKTSILSNAGDLLHWRNSDTTLFRKDLMQIFKVYAIRQPPNQEISSLEDFDIPSFLSILCKLNLFHNDDQTFFNQIKKLAAIRNSSAYMNLNLDFDTQTFYNYWQDIADFVKISSNLLVFSQDTAQYINDHLVQMTVNDGTQVTEIVMQISEISRSSFLQHVTRETTSCWLWIQLLNSLFTDMEEVAIHTEEKPIGPEKFDIVESDLMQGEMILIHIALLEGGDHYFAIESVGDNEARILHAYQDRHTFRVEAPMPIETMVDTLKKLITCRNEHKLKKIQGKLFGIDNARLSGECHRREKVEVRSIFKGTPTHSFSSLIRWAQGNPFRTQVSSISSCDSTDGCSQSVTADVSPADFSGALEKLSKSCESTGVLETLEGVIKCICTGVRRFIGSRVRNQSEDAVKNSCENIGWQNAHQNTRPIMNQVQINEACDKNCDEKTRPKDALSTGVHTGSIQKYMSEEDILKQNLSILDLRIRCNPDPDGSCFFHAILDQADCMGVNLLRELLDIFDKKSRAMCLRNNTVKYFGDLDESNPLKQSLTVPGVARAGEVENMKLYETFVEQWVVEALAQMIGRDIIIVNSVKGTQPYTRISSGQSDTEPFLIGHLLEAAHYLSLEPIEETTADKPRIWQAPSKTDH